MSFFDKLKDVSKKAGTKLQEKAKETADKLKDRRNAMKMLKTLKKSELIKFCDEYGVEYTKSMTRENMIDQIDSSSLSINTQLVTDRARAI